MPLVFLGTDHPCGCYVLRIHLAASTRLRFGGFKKKKLVELRAGEYAYVGSALSLQGSTSLARRLVRHATRNADQAPHAIRATILERFTEIGLASGRSPPPLAKAPALEYRSPARPRHSRIDRRLTTAHTRRLEASLGQFIERDPLAFVFEKGLAPTMSPAITHILRIEAPAAWWKGLRPRLKRHFHL